MRNLEFCDRCLPEKSVTAMGYIPLPEMTNIGDTRVDERKILLCRTHYFEAKENCYYVIPFSRDDDPVDSFFTLVKRKHKRIRGDTRFKFKPPKFSEEEEPMSPVLIGLHPQRNRRIRNSGFRLEKPTLAEKPRLINRNSRKTNPKAKIHFVEDNRITCGMPVASVDSTNDVNFLTCRNCLTILNQRALDEEPIRV